MSNEEDEDKSGRKVRKSPKGRGRSPVPVQAEEASPSPRKSGAKKKEKAGETANQARHIPPNPSRATDKLPTRHNGRNTSPKRSGGGEGDLNESDSNPKTRSTTRSRSPRRGDPTVAPTSPKRSGTCGRSPEPGSRKPRMAKNKGEKPGSNSRLGDRDSGRNPSTSPRRSGSKPRLTKKSSKSRTEDEDESTGDYSSKAPRYVSPKGNTTHLQLDLSKMGPSLKVFSLLDENSLLDASTDDEMSRGNSPKRTTSQGDHSLLGASQNKVQRGPTNELEFKPWGFDSDEEEPQSKKSSFGLTLSPKSKGTLSPHSMKRAVKALKYTKPSMSEASRFVGKLSTGFQQRLGLSSQHQQMEDSDDSDDLAGLLG